MDKDLHYGKENIGKSAKLLYWNIDQLLSPSLSVADCSIGENSPVWLINRPSLFSAM
jgi:hypothetical protein